MIGERLKEARLLAGLTQDQVVQQLADRGYPLSKAGLSKYERSISTPNAQILLQLGRILGVKASYFKREYGVDIQWIAFRKHASLARNQQERIKAMAHKEAEEHIGLWETFYPDRHPDFPAKMEVCNFDDVEKAAMSLRSHWGLINVPLESIVELVEDKGGIVIQTSSAEGDFDGLSGWANERYPVIVNSGAVSDDRRRFNVAHELAHLLLDCENHSEDQEKIAHRFSAAFIVPSEAAFRELGRTRRNISLDELALLKRKYGLSIQAWICRALDLGIITRGHYTALFKLLSKKGWRKAEPNPFCGKEDPIILRQMRERGRAEGITSATAQNDYTVSSNAESTSEREYPSAVELMKLSRKERKQFLAKAVTEVADEYVRNQELTAFEAFGEKDLFDEPE